MCNEILIRCCAPTMACGIRKVYDDVESALRQFARCRHCTEVYLNCLSRGFSLDRLAVAQ